jgi:hypothetical protein
VCEIALFIGMAVLGIYSLATGKVKLTRSKVVSGWPARLIGVILLLPFPLTLLVGVAIGAYLVSQGGVGAGARPEDIQARMPPWVPFIGIGMAVLCVIVCVIIGAATGAPPKKERRDDYDDRRDRRDDYDDRRDRRDDDYPPRGRDDDYPPRRGDGISPEPPRGRDDDNPPRGGGGISPEPRRDA